MSQDQYDEVGDDVQWWLDADGTEWFVEDGVRFELAEDGLAHPVVGGTTDPTGATPLELLPEDAAPEDAAPEQPAEPDEPDEAPGGPAGTDEVADEPAVDDTQVVPVVTAGPAEDPEEVGGAVATRASSATDDEPLLRISGLDAGYGSLPVLHGVELAIGRGQTAVLLGLNGAGKTTTALTVCGALSPWGGTITYDGADVAGWSARAAVGQGVVMVPEGRRVFADLSVGRNLQVGAWSKRADGDVVDAMRERVFDYFPRLREREDQLAGTLSGGEQQMLAIGRGLMADPRLLIIDEASMGLAPVIVRDVFDIIAQINADGVTVLLIEQNVGALEVADVGYVMEQGRMLKVLQGDDLRDRSVVSAALMG